MNLKQLSEKLGLSQTTVSRALNGYPEVSEETRLRVAEAARRHNYRPNMRARGLATGRAMAIGHVIPLSAKFAIVNPIFADFIAGAGEIYARSGYDMVLSIVNESEEARVYGEMKSKGNVDGVIVHSPRHDDPRIAQLGDIGLPFLVHGRSSGCALPYAWLDVNNRHAFERAAGFLLDLGHRRMALLNGPEEMDFAIRRRSGYAAALTAAGLVPDPELMLCDEMTEAFGHRAAADLLAAPEPPTAFLVASMLIAIGVRRAIEERGLRFGRDVSVVTFDDDLSYLSNLDAVPVFTAMRSSVREAGRRAAAMLLRMIAEPGIGLPSQLLEAELVVGQSTGPAPRG
ncbi:MAG: LacI family DNA-binding transcriptional regulator [Defluviimonas sp.]|uniref:LacI family DNA-binding transcriptional regulator n=1 Tax=Albidovulum sp. TaxID=1872424 RepID=UPI001DF23D53|nr:substrate-binding domain-containing protein [Paracoccaceae bacterium]MCC0062552.1 LacI family DNA-binding transcriptional regulator [Defluviimonas sp.]